jgi:catechol 2,3-dioxygenase-like lactoylglutathione lyase family enzyme
MKKILLVLWLSGCVLLAKDHPRPRILGIAHISLFVHDLTTSRAFYRDFLGFQEPFDLKKEDGSLSMTFFKVGDHQYIELSPEREAGSDRLNHWAIETDDAEGMRQYLAEHGVKVPATTPKGRIGNLNFMVKDPEGHDLEIVQYPATGKTAQAYGKFMPTERISTHIRHVGIIVTKLDPEMKFFTEVLGFSETWRGNSAASKTLSWVNLKVPDGKDYVELMLYEAAPEATKRGSAHHLSLEVPDATASVAALNGKEYRQRYQRTIEIRTGINRKRQVNLFDPDGTRTELMEPNTVDGKPALPSTAPPPGM